MIHHSFVCLAWNKIQRTLCVTERKKKWRENDRGWRSWTLVGVLWWLGRWSFYLSIESRSLSSYFLPFLSRLKPVIFMIYGFTARKLPISKTSTVTQQNLQRLLTRWLLLEDTTVFVCDINSSCCIPGKGEGYLKGRGKNCSIRKTKMQLLKPWKKTNKNIKPLSRDLQGPAWKPF